MNEVVHVSIRKVDSTEAWKNCHDSHSNNADSRNALLDCEDSAIDGKQWERIPDPPEAVQIAEP